MMLEPDSADEKLRFMGGEAGGAEPTLRAGSQHTRLRQGTYTLALPSFYRYVDFVSPRCRFLSRGRFLAGMILLNPGNLSLSRFFHASKLNETDRYESM